MYKKYYQHFLNHNKGKLHFASHSHHYWPDVTKEAVIQCWEDSAKLVDDKWNKWFSEEIPAAQKHISKILNFSRPDDIAFGSNVHGFINRLYSCLDPKKKKRILTTDSEFHSFERQLKRWLEDKDVTVDRIKVSTKEDFLNFENQITKLIDENFYEMIYLSTGFFNSGLQLKAQWIEKLLSKISQDTLIVLDSYHTFAAVPFDMSKLEDRVFFLGGSYKYAQGGEGACFMTLPKDCKLRPRDTGWFAHFEGLSGEMGEKIGYSNGGLRFWGATMDMNAIYRFNASWDLFENIGLDINKIHNYIQQLQKEFIGKLPDQLKTKLINQDLDLQGHFLTFQFDSNQEASDFYNQLKSNDVITDFRDNRLRFGFGLYQEQEDIGKITYF